MRRGKIEFPPNDGDKCGEHERGEGQDRASIRERQSEHRSG